MATIKLTDRAIRALEAPPLKNGQGSNRITYDSAVSGFGARITSTGAISFILNYRRKADGLERRHTIGAFPNWSVGVAREEARRLRRDIDGGGDPVGALKAGREAPAVADLCQRFEAEHLPNLRASTARMYRGIIKTDIVPAIGRLKVAAVEFTDIDKLRREVSGRAPYLANRMIAMLSKMFALAVLWKMCSNNPARGIQKNPETKRKRYLSTAEIQRLTKVLAEYPNREAADAIHLILLTGARKSEVLSATWSQFEPWGTWTKPGSTTKQKTEHVVPLNAPALQLLAKIRERGKPSEFIFPGPGPTGRRMNLKRDWLEICKAANIVGLRIHDLRHSYASILVSAGQSLPIIGELLGHSSPITTKRYAHLFDRVLRRATERVGKAIAGQQSAEIVPLGKRGRR
jgi:integrase